MGSAKENGTEDGMEDGVIHGEVMDDREIFFSESDKQKANGLTRVDLMKMKAEVIAQMAIDEGKSDLPLETLTKKGKKYICNLLLLNEKEAKRQENSGRVSGSKSDTETIVETVIDFFKEIMDLRGKKMNRLLEKIFRRSATPYIDQKVKDDELSIHKVNTFSLIVSGIFIVVDAAFGLGEISDRIKERVKKSRESKQSDA